jgi:hypothetical protein
MIEKPRDFLTQVYCIIGPTGCGKTREVNDRWPDAYWYSKGNNTWFDGYDSHEVVVFDDFRGGIPVSLLLRLADRTPLKVETKGGFVNFKARILVFTSTVTPANWYRWEQLGGYEQWIRRMESLKLYADDATFDEPTYLELKGPLATIRIAEPYRSESVLSSESEEEEKTTSDFVASILRDPSMTDAELDSIVIQ